MSRDPQGVTNSDSPTQSPGAEGASEAGEGGRDAQIADLEARLRAVSSAYKQAKDEISATKERLERNALVREEYRRGEIVSAVFEPVENLHRSIQAVVGVAPEAAEGLTMVHQQFMQALHNLGLEEVGAEGQAFDPKLHEAILSQPAPEPSMDGLILNVFSKGYRIGSKVIRPARVVIAVYTPPAEVGEA
jgi:molecular chaperone GrpE